jgi:hypothetical protein
LCVKGGKKERAAENFRSDTNPLGKELQSLKRTTAVLKITTETVCSEWDVERTVAKETSLKQDMLEKLRTSSTACWRRNATNF